MNLPRKVDLFSLFPTRICILLGTVQNHFRNNYYSYKVSFVLFLLSYKRKTKSKSCIASRIPCADVKCSLSKGWNIKKLSRNLNRRCNVRDIAP